ncbi:NUDIX domain-containing protein [Streptomyces sp. NRRL B-3648]|uniref:NUDIX domain-containing protein n=1 Tax=Streptomyces sp. NRRL B-3648 TaxID=1519493 RepID=UPI00099D000B|nr:NUDIX domain-containing protein [Streptomyces sp. NRRL B-3648]
MSAQPAAPVIDTHVIVRDGDLILLSRRGSPYGYGRWHMPSGKLDRGEPLHAGAARELFEETGITVAPHDLRLVQVTGRSGYQDLRNAFRRERSAAYSAWLAEVVRDHRVAVLM